MTDKILSLSDAIVLCLKNGGKVLLYGNGGFAAIANHFATELMGRYKISRKPLPAVSLSANSSLITCIGNDFGFERIFSRQIEGLGESKDITIGMTTSGKSKNIYEALYACARIGCSSWIITGNRMNDILNDLCENIITIESDDTAVIQNRALGIMHEVCDYIDTNVSNDNPETPFKKAIAYAHNGARILLLDRDGVVNSLLPNDYVLNPQCLSLCKSFKDNAAELARAYDKIFIVTNQKCVGKGILSLKELNSLHRYLISMIEDCGGRIDDVFSATSSDLSSKDYKPQTGLVNLIIEKYKDFNPQDSVMIGDSYSDYLFAKRIGATFIYN